MGAQIGAQPVRDIGRYRVYDEIASGGMATVSFGRLLGPVGFSRTVAIKQLHAQFAKDPEFVAMFLDEARLAARIHHPNVVATLDVVATNGDLVLVMDYVHGESLSRLLRASPKLVPPKIVAAVIAGALHGLHAAHEARSERGEPLHIVHRDISPQNILVGVDGVPRVLDFGVAKASHRLQTTQEGHLKGKIRYMPPEQVLGHDVDRQADIYAMGVVLFEMLTGRSLFPKGDPPAVMHEILHGTIPKPSSVAPEIPAVLDAIVLRALAREKTERFGSAQEMALALEEAVGLATASQIATWVQTSVEATLSARAATVSAIESRSSSDVVTPPPASQPAIAQGIAELPTGKTAFTASPAQPASGNGFTIALAICGVLATLGIGLMLVVLRRPPPVAPVVVSEAPPATSSAPAPVLLAASAEAATSAAPSTSAVPKKPAAPAIVPGPRPTKDDDMARSRR